MKKKDRDRSLSGYLLAQSCPEQVYPVHSGQLIKGGGDKTVPIGINE